MQTEKFTISPAEIEDIPALMQLIRSLAEYEHLADEVVAGESELLRDGFGEQPLFHARVARLTDGTAAGFALYFFTYSTFQGSPTLKLEDLFVMEEYRGRGIGSALFMALIAEAKRRHCGRMEWTVLEWNKGAARFYQRLGAHRLGGWQTYRLSGKALEEHYLKLG